MPVTAACCLKCDCLAEHDHLQPCWRPLHGSSTCASIVKNVKAARQVFSRHARSQILVRALCLSRHDGLVTHNARVRDPNQLSGCA